MRFAIIIFAAVLYWPVPSRGQAQQTPQNVSAGDQQAAANHQNQTAAPAAAEKADSVENYSAEEAKAALSQATANWWIVRFTGALLFVGFIQATIYAIQCFMMRRAIDQSRESSERQLRAYICILNQSKAGREENCWASLAKGEVKLIFKNTGQTPAYDVISHVFWNTVEGLDAHLPEKSTFPGFESIAPSAHRRVGSSDLLGSQQTASTIGTLETQPSGLTFMEAYRKFEAGEMITVFLFARVLYRDAFGNERFTQFCAKLGRFKDGDNIKSAVLTYDRHNQAN